MWPLGPARAPAGAQEGSRPDVTDGRPVARNIGSTSRLLEFISVLRVTLFVCGFFVLAVCLLWAPRQGRRSRPRYAPGWAAAYLGGTGLCLLVALDMAFIALRGNAGLWLVLHRITLVACSVAFLSIVLVASGAALERYTARRFSRVAEVATLALGVVACLGFVVLIVGMVGALVLKVIETI